MAQEGTRPGAKLRQVSAVPHIGLLREGSLHAALKEWYAQPGDLVEAPCDGYVVDLLRGDLAIELQTGHFAALRPKLAALLERRRVRVVHPVAAERVIVRIDEDGVVLGRRRSPLRGTVLSLFDELVSLAPLLSHPGLELEVVLVRDEEVRRPAPPRGRRWRRHARLERRLLDVVGTQRLGGPQALGALLPATLDGPFTTAELAAVLGVPLRLAQRIVYCLRACGELERAGKRGRAPLHAQLRASSASAARSVASVSAPSDSA
jgi:hypothetical protein